MTLCLNCLEPTTSRPTPVGYSVGQRDPVQPTLVLCDSCKTALVEGDLKTFAARYQVSRDIQR